MTDQLTDEYLAKRAEELARDKYQFDTFVRLSSGTVPSRSATQGARWSVFYANTLSALKVHRDGLRVLEKHRNHIQEHLGRMVSGLDSARRMTAEIDQVDNHIASLRELLGVSQ